MIGSVNDELDDSQIRDLNSNSIHANLQTNNCTVVSKSLEVLENILLVHFSKLFDRRHFCLSVSTPDLFCEIGNVLLLKDTDVFPKRGMHQLEARRRARALVRTSRRPGTCALDRGHQK